MENTKPERRQGGLCITRNIDEGITIETSSGEIITITYYEKMGRRIRLRICAPQGTGIARTEAYIPGKRPPSQSS